jgi:D-Tyr-tRNAtyr deacylase
LEAGVKTKKAVNSSDQREIIQILSEKIKAYYVFPDIAEQISKSLQDHLQKGDYAGITKGDELASILSKHLQEVN